MNEPARPNPDVDDHRANLLASSKSRRYDEGQKFDH
jgi:hypothetical protein